LGSGGRRAESGVQRAKSGEPIAKTKTRLPGIILAKPGTT